jgi:glyoxylase-like metal-dependent hydrolase (beta-lactamase superfamily II)
MSELHFPIPNLPAAGERLAVAEGVYWLRFPLPFALDHINLWLLEDGDGWLLVDTGLGGADTRELWLRSAPTLLQGRPIRRIVVTHYHPDHIGQAAWLARHFQARVYMTAGEWELARAIQTASDADTGEDFARLFGRHGLDAERVEGLRRRGNPYRRGVPELPERVEPLKEGDVLEVGGRRWQVLIGRGHAPEHACLYCAEAGLLISGDQVLPKISSNVSVRPREPEADPVGEFLDSLRALAALPEDTRVLPAHGRVFVGLHARIAQLEAHHAEQLGVVEAACRSPQTAASLLPVMFKRELNLHTLMFAMGEAIGHLNHLHRQMRLLRAEVDGVLRFGVPAL